MNGKPTDPVQGLVGIARKGGNASLGRTAVREALRDGRGHLVLLARDAGAALVDEMVELTRRSRVPMMRFAGREMLGRALGRSEVSVLSIDDNGIALAIQQKLETGETDAARPDEGRQQSARRND